MTTQPLSPQQVESLHLLRERDSMTTQEFSDAAPFVHSDDQARNLLARLEKRGFISGEGHGRTRVWAYVSSPDLERALGPAAPPARAAADPATWSRTYVVLEQRHLDELVGEILSEASVDLTDDQADVLREFGTVFDEVAGPEARNTEHALRSAAKEVYGELPGAHAPRMVAVATRHFQVETVNVRNQSTVSVG